MLPNFGLINEIVMKKPVLQQTSLTLSDTTNQ
jgi:hypothetical protein